MIRIALDDLSDDDLIDAMGLLWWMRVTERPIYVTLDCASFRIAKNLQFCGLAEFSLDEDDDNVARVDLIRRART